MITDPARQSSLAPTVRKEKAPAGGVPKPGPSESSISVSCDSDRSVSRRDRLLNKSLVLRLLQT